MVLQPENLREQVRVFGTEMMTHKSVLEKFEEAYTRDEFPTKVLEAMKQGPSKRVITVGECSEKNGYLYHRGKKYGPEDHMLQLL